METKIQDILDTLTPEEKEAHKDLINECIERETRLVKYSENTRRKIAKLCDMMDGIIYNIQYVSNIVESTNNTLKLLSISDDKFFNA